MALPMNDWHIDFSNYPQVKSYLIAAQIVRNLHIAMIRQWLLRSIVVWRDSHRVGVGDLEMSQCAWRKDQADGC